MKYIKGNSTLIEKKSLTESVIELKFRLHQEITWLPGEFINLNVGGDNWRSYSVLSYEDDVVTFIIDLRPDGVGSKFFRSVEVNTDVNFIGPFGKFLLEDSEKFLFICTGTGLAPIIPMIKKLLEEGVETIQLLYGVRYDNEDILHQYFSKEELKKVNVVRCITRSVRTDGVFTGRVTDFLRGTGDLGEFDAYICGNPKMVIEVSEIVVEKGVSKVIIEKY